jgi:hypothetical protein
MQGSIDPSQAVALVPELWGQVVLKLRRVDRVHIPQTIFQLLPLRGSDWGAAEVPRLRCLSSLRLYHLRDTCRFQSVGTFDRSSGSQRFRGRCDLLLHAKDMLVFNTCMRRSRNNPDIEDSRVHAILNRWGLDWKSGAVDLASSDVARQPMTLEQAMAMRGAHAILETPTDRIPMEAG